MRQPPLKESARFPCFLEIFYGLMKILPKIKAYTACFTPRVQWVATSWRQLHCASRTFFFPLKNNKDNACQPERTPHSTRPKLGGLTTANDSRMRHAPCAPEIIFLQIHKQMKTTLTRPTLLPNLYCQQGHEHRDMLNCFIVAVFYGLKTFFETNFEQQSSARCSCFHDTATYWILRGT